MQIVEHIQYSIPAF